MSMITVDQLERYANHHSDADADLLQIYIDSAELVVKDYLGYDPAAQTYTHLANGDGSKAVQLRAKPITAIISVTVSGVSVNANRFITTDEMLIYADGVTGFPCGTGNVVVNYTAGYASIPGAIKLAVMKVAALMATESGGNIGVTSKQFGDAGSRTFINTTDYAKHLRMLDRLKITRL